MVKYVGLQLNLSSMFIMADNEVYDPRRLITGRL